MKMRSLVIIAAAIFSIESASAQINPSETPEYSGPSARFDTGFDRYRTEQSQKRQTEKSILNRQMVIKNDRAYDKNLKTRDIKIQQELTRYERELRQQTFNE